MTDIFVTYTDKSQIERIGDFKKESPIFHLIDVESLKGKKEAWKLKSHWAARLDPFVIIMDGEKPIKAFYSEADSDVIGSVLKYIEECL